MLHLTSDDSFVFYRLPDSNIIEGNTGKWLPYKNEESGFIVQAFDRNKSYILAEAHPINIQQPIKVLNNIDKVKSNNTTITKDLYLQQVKRFIDACNNGLDKVISSRIYSYSSPASIYQLFLKLTQAYPDAFVYLLNIPTVGMWMGASPEVLIKEKNNHLETMALAGSLPFNPGSKPSWSNKELKEHHFVVEDITQKLTRAGLKAETKPLISCLAGRVVHLKTPIIIHRKKDDNIKDVADILHPTSAVCGMPQNKALKFIIENEPHNRELYTGYLGIINAENSALFVNLRCMKIYKNCFDLYLGGGITKDSVPEKEWEETELKSQTLLAVIEKI